MKNTIVPPTQNAMMSLALYREETTWKFDDDRKAIIAEPFVLGMSEIISSYLPENNETSTIIFSANPFPGAHCLMLEREEANGGWYHVKETGMRGWLCPVTRVYMGGVPSHIYFHVFG
jgi:hypothetical protein